jgi:hypothetical protein
MIGGLVARFEITVIRPSFVDDGRGGQVEDWNNATRTGSAGWAVDAGDTSEDLDGRSSTTAHWTIRGPFAADVRATDHVGLFGDECEIVGAVLRQPGPSTMTSHTILRLRRVTG